MAEQFRQDEARRRGFAWPLVGTWTAVASELRSAVARAGHGDAPLTAALVLSRRRDWVWYIAGDVAISLAMHGSRLGASQLLFAQAS